MNLTIQKASEHLQNANYSGYFEEMDIDRDVLAKMNMVPSGSLEKLSFSELKASKLVTEPVFAARELTSAVCQVLPPPDNCIWR